MSKRIISLLLCIVMLIPILASCNTDDSHNHETSESTTEQPQGTESDHTDDETNGEDETTETPEQHTHTPATAVTEKFVDSSCTATGSYDEVIYCSECQEEINRTQKTVDKKTHEYNQKVITSTYLKASADCNNAAVYYYSCVCGAVGDKTGNRVSRRYPSVYRRHRSIINGSAEIVDEELMACHMSVGQPLIFLGKTFFIIVLNGSEIIPLPDVICHLVFEFGIGFRRGHRLGIDIITDVLKLNTLLGMLNVNMLGITELIARLGTVECRHRGAGCLPSDTSALVNSDNTAVCKPHKRECV
jgi:hypothetical protein